MEAHMSDEQKTNGQSAGIRAARGPAYPYLNLERAVEKAVIVAEKGAARQKMAPETFYSLWGMGAKSSSSRQSMAALNQYNLVEYVGTGRDRRVQLTELALRIVLDKRPNSAEKIAAIQEAALGPNIFRELHDKYAPFLPDDVIMETFLTLDRAFSDDAAKTVVKHFRDTIVYSGLDKPTDMPNGGSNDSSDTGNGSTVESEQPKVEIGDKVQATIQGIDQFAEGATVQGLSEDGEFVFVDLSDSGVPIKDVTVLEAAKTEKAPAPPSKPTNLATRPILGDAPLPEGTRRAMFPLEEGDVILTFPVGLAEDSLEDLSAYLDIFLKKEIKKAKGAQND